MPYEYIGIALILGGMTAIAMAFHRYPVREIEYNAIVNHDTPAANEQRTEIVRHRDKRIARIAVAVATISIGFAITFL